MPTEAEKAGLGEYAGIGFTLDHVGDDFIDLHHNGEYINRFSQLGATPEELQAACARHLIYEHDPHAPKPE